MNKQISTHSELNRLVSLYRGQSIIGGICILLFVLSEALKYAPMIVCRIIFATLSISSVIILLRYNNQLRKLLIREPISEEMKITVKKQKLYYNITLIAALLILLFTPRIQLWLCALCCGVIYVSFFRIRNISSFLQ